MMASGRNTAYRCPQPPAKTWRRGRCFGAWRNGGRPACQSPQNSSYADNPHTESLYRCTFEWFPQRGRAASGIGLHAYYRNGIWEEQKVWVLSVAALFSEMASALYIRINALQLRQKAYLQPLQDSQARIRLQRPLTICTTCRWRFSGCRGSAGNIRHV